MARIPFADSVFINCPFDKEYAPLLEVITFTVFACGFQPRSALDSNDGGEVRVLRIARLMASSRYAIHDLSRTQTNSRGFPRFNMPFELGIDWALKHHGTREQRSKKMLLLERRQHTLKQYLSDIGGQDPVAHQNSPKPLISAVRNFLATSSGRKGLPGDIIIGRQFRLFSKALPEICQKSGLNPKRLQYVDYKGFARDWLKANN